MVIIRPISKEVIRRAKPIFLAVSSVVLNAVALATSIKATVETTRIVDTKAEIVDKKELVKEIAPKFVLPAVAFTLGQVATIGSAILSRNQTVALSAAAAAANYRFSRYRKGVVDIYGEEADKNVISTFEHVPEAVRRNYSYYITPYGGPGEVTIANMPEGKNLLFDINRVGETRKDGTIDDGYFLISKDQFLQGRQLFTDEYFEEGHVELNTLYNLWGLDTTYGGDILGYDFSDGPQRIQIGLREKDYDKDGNVLSYSVEYYWPLIEWPHADPEDDIW